MLLDGAPAAVGNYTTSASTTLVLDNGLLRMTLVARGAGVTMSSFVVGGVDLATRDGEEAWYQDWSGGKGGDVAGVDTVRVVRVSPSLVEVSHTTCRNNP